MKPVLFCFLLFGLVLVHQAVADSADAGDAGISSDDAGIGVAVVTAPGPAVKPAAAQSAWAQIKAFYLAYAPWVLGVLAPSIVTALLASPKTSKIGDKLKWVLGLFSLVTHYDSPTSFKLPLMPVPKATDPPEIKPGA